MDADVLVLGAGFTGVPAARDQRDAGRRVTLMEARDRIGGRTWYREMPGAGVPVEYGGMFLSRATQPHLAAEIERYGVAVTPAITPDEVAWIRSTERREGQAAIEELRKALNASGLPDAVAAAEKAVPAEVRTSLVEQDVTASEWIDRLGATEEAADFLRAFMVAMGGARLEAMSVLPVLWDMVELGYGPTDVFIDVSELFTEGTKSLIDAMASGLDVRFGSVVRRVEHDDAGVRVILAGRGALEAPAAVVALPLNLWADVAFDLPLAAHKRRAEEERHPRAVSKVLAVVRDAPARFVAFGWDTPINAGFVNKAAPDGSRRGRAGGARPPSGRDRPRDRRPRLGERSVLEGHVALSPADLVQRRDVRGARGSRRPAGVRRLGHRLRGSRLDRGCHRSASAAATRSNAVLTGR